MAEPRCSMCKRLLQDRAHAPFCSERCQTMDLANWLDGSYRLEGPLTAEDAALLAVDLEEN